MQWYAETPARRTRQVTGDLLAVAWVVLWVLIARWAFDLVRLLAVPAEPLRTAGTTVQTRMDDVAGQIGEVPLVGDRLTGPFTGAADAGGSLVSAGDALDTGVTRVAWLLSVFVGAVPILFVVGVYVLLRAHWARRTTELARLREGDSALELLALRALVHQSPRRLVRVDPDPLGAWRAGDEQAISDLAGLELARVGLRPQRLSAG
ncbi:hypothetical protein NF556_10465 [Ornithinimicrobium faecis]|uniref:Uncharacterized protein n=1 Tax=Ornithinimicrobium faecis TaxID=2934158 RepID=A0ABY4Z0A2_9MICO|nr:hypothetical protein [Ornithinimicrobium sp. HY1793]USQ82038.1 hypothetical protein NF556_10465 [Ornithinimicrobium sp. HY1793]